MTETTDLFVPPAAEGLPLAALDSATDGASALDAFARTPYGRNLLAHALVQLARDGWLRAEPAAVPSAPADRAAIERVRSVLESEAVVGRSALDYRGLIASALMADQAPASDPSRVADEAQQPEAETASPTAALLSSRCDACRHTLNWHRNDVGCTVALCVCGRFQPPADEEPTS